jgi:hypothetical protein
MFLVRVQTRVLLDDGAAGVVLKVEQIMCILGHLGPPDIELRADEVTSYVEVLTPLELLLVTDQEQHDRRVGPVSEASFVQGSSVMCNIFLMASSTSPPMTAPFYGAVGSTGVSTRTSQQFRPWA